MKLGKVIGTLTPSVVYEGIEGVPMLLVQPLNKYQKPVGQSIVSADSTVWQDTVSWYTMKVPEKLL